MAPMIWAISLTRAPAATLRGLLLQQLQDSGRGRLAAWSGVADDCSRPKHQKLPQAFIAGQSVADADEPGMARALVVGWPEARIALGKDGGDLHRVPSS